MHFAPLVTGSVPITDSEGLVSTAHQETIRVNVIGTLTLADLCATHGIHMTNFATGAPEALQIMSHRIHNDSGNS